MSTGSFSSGSHGLAAAREPAVKTKAAAHKTPAIAE